MVRLTRAQQQERTRATVLAAAVAEFGRHGYADAKIDRIAERAELTRGAVYSNFPSKRSLYLAVLLESVVPPGAPSGGGAEAFARVRLERVPLTGDNPVQARSLTGVFDDPAGRATMAGLARLESLLLSVALGSSLRLADLILTLLDGAGRRDVDPFDVVRAVGHLTALELPDPEPPHRAFAAAALPEPDALPLPGYEDGLVVVLGDGRIGAAPDAVRSGLPVTLALVTDDPAERGALIRLRVHDFLGDLGRVFPPLPRIRLQLDGSAASALGVPVTSDTETAVRIAGGQVVARSSGRGAGLGVWP